jgi:cobalt-zinc-cadmium efflux system protein
MSEHNHHSSHPNSNPTPTHHGHHGGHGHHHSAIGNIGFAFLLNFVFSIIEIAGGLWIGSLAIVADAVHDFGDSISLGIAWLLERYANRTKDQRFNFGYKRFSLLSALISGVVISAGSAIIVVESIRRFHAAHAPAGLPMIGLALVGLAVNGIAAFRLSKGHTQNEKVLTWHLIEDVIGWGLVLLGAIAITLTGLAWIDPILAIGLSIFVFYNVIRHLKDTAYLFLQGRPENFNEPLFIKETLAVAGVEKVDALAVWSLDGDSSVLSARLHLHSVRDPLEIERVKKEVRVIASRQSAIATLETCMAEHSSHDDDDHDHHDHDHEHVHDDGEH